MTPAERQRQRLRNLERGRRTSAKRHLAERKAGERARQTSLLADEKRYQREYREAKREVSRFLRRARWTEDEEAAWDRLDLAQSRLIGTRRALHRIAPTKDRRKT